MFCKFFAGFSRTRVKLFSFRQHRQLLFFLCFCRVSGLMENVSVEREHVCWAESQRHHHNYDIVRKKVSWWFVILRLTTAIKLKCISILNELLNESKAHKGINAHAQSKQVTVESLSNNCFASRRIVDIYLSTVCTSKFPVLTIGKRWHRWLNVFAQMLDGVSLKHKFVKCAHRE